MLLFVINIFGRELPERTILHSSKGMTGMAHEKAITLIRSDCINAVSIYGVGQIRAMNKDTRLRNVETHEIDGTVTDTGTEQQVPRTQVTQVSDTQLRFLQLFRDWPMLLITFLSRV